MIKKLVAAFLGSLIPVATHVANAQTDYPNKPIRFVLVASAGGGGDAIARMLAEKTSSRPR